jgi:hypothetical protein
MSQFYAREEYSCRLGLSFAVAPLVVIPEGDLLLPLQLLSTAARAAGPSYWLLARRTRPIHTIRPHLRSGIGLSLGHPIDAPIGVDH